MIIAAINHIEKGFSAFAEQAAFAIIRGGLGKINKRKDQDMFFSGNK